MSGLDRYTTAYRVRSGDETDFGEVFDTFEEACERIREILEQRGAGSTAAIRRLLTERRPEETPVLGRCPHGYNLDVDFCPHGCRV